MREACARASKMLRSVRSDHAGLGLPAIALLARPGVPERVDECVVGYVQRDACGTLPAETAITSPVAAAFIQIGVRGHGDRYAPLGDSRESALAFPMIAGSGQKAICRDLDRYAAIVRFAISAFTQPSGAVGRIDGVGVLRNLDLNACVRRSAITAIAAPAPVVP